MAPDPQIPLCCSLKRIGWLYPIFGDLYFHRRLLGCFLVLLGSALDAATIKGVIVDNYTGRPLARTAVTLVAFYAWAANPPPNHTDSYGRFTFEHLPAGAYLLSATRPAFAKLQYRQEAWNSPGKPLLVEKNDVINLPLRMRRLGAISGFIWDENEIGFPEVEVLAYTSTQPPKLVAKTKTGDRGAYRIGSLEPGTYFVRTAAKQLVKETGLLPTFYKEVAPAREARKVSVALEDEATGIDFRPLFGDVFRISGEVPGRFPDVTVTLVSDMGRTTQHTGSSGQFTFDELAPGRYELLAVGREHQTEFASHRQILVERDSEELKVHLLPLAKFSLHFEAEAGNDLAPENVQALVRRKDLAGISSTKEIPTAGGELLPGGWEIRISPSEEYYSVSITGRAVADKSRSWAGGWREIHVHPAERVTLRARLSSDPALLAGMVTQSQDPVIGAPVYLEAVDSHGNSLGEVRTTRSDRNGQYRFSGLAPGKYQVLSSFEPRESEQSLMTLAPARILSLKEGSETRQDLELHVSR